MIRSNTYDSFLHELVQVLAILGLQQGEVPLGLRVVRVAGCHAFLLHVEALGRAQNGRGRGREFAGGGWARIPGAARGPRTPRGKGESSPSSFMSRFLLSISHSQWKVWICSGVMEGVWGVEGVMALEGVALAAGVRRWTSRPSAYNAWRLTESASPGRGPRPCGSSSASPPSR